MSRGTDERRQRYRVIYGEARKRYSAAKADLDWAELDYGEKCAKLALGEVEEPDLAALETEIERLRAVVRREAAAIRWLWDEVGAVGTGASSPVPAGA